MNNLIRYFFLKPGYGDRSEPKLREKVEKKKINIQPLPLQLLTEGENLSKFIFYCYVICICFWTQKIPTSPMLYH